MREITVPPWEPPEFLEGQDVESVHKRMLEMIPADLDKSEGQFVWDMTRPSALVKAEAVQYQLNEALKLIFPQWAYGRWLDYHGELRGMERRPATHAYGYVEVRGIRGTEIPEGYLFATAAVPESPSIEFRTLETAVVGEDALARIPCEAVLPGPVGNVAEDMIKLMVKPMTGINEIKNPSYMTGGADVESDESLRIRILEYDNGIGNSFVGNDSDYVRWAKEVPGVGSVVVIPEWNGPGTVRVVAVDVEGRPANDLIVSRVYEHIVSPDDRMERLAPIGALVTVAAPEPVSVYVEASGLKLETGETTETIIERFTAGLQQYYLQAVQEGEVKYIYVWSVLAETEGVHDFTALKVNGCMENIPLALDEYPVTEGVVLRV